MNPLLKELQDCNKGYKAGDRTISVQAYADDVVLFAESRSGMNRLIEIVERFMEYSRLSINIDKCHSLAYIIGERGRVTDTTPFSIRHRDVPLVNLSGGIEYLGSSAAASICVRYKGTEEAITDAKNIIKKVMDSQLKVNQKLDALRRFVIPCLDYTLTEGSPRLRDLEDLDKMMRKGIANHVGVPSLPIAFTETHWKDGGLSLQPLKVRSSVLRVKKFIALYNSPNSQTRTLFRYFTESEREFRRIRKIKEGEESKFLDWETNEQGKFINSRSGTSSITGTVNKDCRRLRVHITLIGNKASLIVNTNMGTTSVESSQLASQILMRRHSKEAREKLLEDGMHGHSFVNLQDQTDSNYLIGNYTNKVSDKIISFMIAARTNELYTGYISHLNGNHNGPKCPYCGCGNEEDTLFHRLNNCTPARFMYTYRHNLVASALMKQIKAHYPEAIIRQNQSVRVQGSPPLDGEEGRLRPDISIILPKEIILVEISCPYDTTKDDGSTALDITYSEKKEKYEELRKRCESQFNRPCKTYVVIVSSLGTIHKNTLVDLKHLFRLKKEAKSLKYMGRRISTAAIIGSFLTFHKVNIRQSSEDPPTASDHTIGDVSREEPNLPDNLHLL